jgi:hypothetical protein
MESRCVGESDHDWVVQQSQGPHEDALGHLTSRWCRRCNVIGRWLVRVPCCPRCHTHPVRHESLSAEHGEHTPYKGHRLQRVCDACHERIDSGLHEKKPGCAACFLAAPAIERPARGAELPLGPVAIEWSRIDGATHYLLEVVDAGTGDMLAGFPRAVTEPGVTLPADALAYGHAYFVDVAAVSDMDGPTWSPELLRAFRIEPALRIEGVAVANVTDLAPGSHHHARIESRQASGPSVATAEVAWDTLPALEIWAIAVEPGTTGAVVTWKSSSRASSQVRVNGRWHGDEWPGSDGGNTEHEVRVGGLRPGTLYSMLVRSRRAPGLSSATAAGTFSTLRVLTISDIEISAGETTLAVRWQTNLPARARIHVDGQWHEETWPGQDRGGKGHRFDVKGLVPGTRYELTIESRQAPALPAVTVTRELTTRPALVIADVAARSALEEDGSLSAVVTWTTNHPASSWVRVGGTWFGQDHATDRHGVRVSGLSPVQPCQADIESRQAPRLSMAAQTIEIPRIWNAAMELAATGSTMTAIIRWKTSHALDSAVAIDGASSSDARPTTDHDACQARQAGALSARSPAR